MSDFGGPIQYSKLRAFFHAMVTAGVWSEEEVPVQDLLEFYRGQLKKYQDKAEEARVKVEAEQNLEVRQKWLLLLYLWERMAKNVEAQIKKELDRK